MGLRAKKQAQVRQAIFEAAMALFAAKGFEATTMEEIAERAEVSRATVFNHFGTKEGVLRHYGQQLSAALLDRAALLEPEQSPLERLRLLLEAWVQHAEAHREQVRLVYLYSMRDPGYLQGLTPARAELWHYFADLVTRAQQAGQIRTDLPARYLAMHLLSVYQNAILARLLEMAELGPLVESAWKFTLGGLTHVDLQPE